MHNIVCIYTHILYQIYLHFVSSSLLHNGNRRVAILFLGVVVFTFPPKNIHGATVKKRSAKARIRATFLATHNAAATVPLRALLLVTRLADGGKTAGFSGHSEAFSRIFVGRSQKISNWCQEKQTKKCMYIYIYLYM